MMDKTIDHTEIIEYSTAAAENHFALVKIVDEQIKAKWQPFNSVYQYQYGDQLLLCQPMVRYGVVKKTAVKK